MSHEDYKEMIPASALSALDAADERALTEHLSHCAECRRELDEWQQTTATLTLTVNPEEPSDHVREQILSRIRAERSDQAPRVIPFKTPQRNVWTSLGSVGAIAAAILFVILLVYVVALWRENRSIRNQIQDLYTRNQKAEEKLNFMRLLQAPGAKLAELSGTSAAPGALAKIAYDQTGHAMVMTSGLPAVPEGKQYQLWYIVGDKPPMRGKTFSTDNHGEGMIEDQLPSVALKSAAFAVTLEPMGGSDTPTMPIYLSSGS